MLFLSVLKLFKMKDCFAGAARLRERYAPARYGYYLMRRVRCIGSLKEKRARVQAKVCAPWVPTGFLRAILAVMSFWTILNQRAFAVDPPQWSPAPVPDLDSPVLDLELTLRAREALARDRALAGLNIYVNVHGRIVTVRGKVPAAALVDKIRACLQNVRGVTEVRSLLRDDSPDPSQDGKLDLVPIQTRVPIAEKIAPLPPRTKGSVVRRPRDEGWTPGLPQVWRPTQDVPVSSPTQLNPPASAPTLGETIESMRLAERRFQAITFAIERGVVTLKGRVYRWEHVAEFAQIIARLPGVKRVNLDQVVAEISP
jgi:hypothetical protein